MDLPENISVRDCPGFLPTIIPYPKNSLLKILTESRIADRPLGPHWSRALKKILIFPAL